MLPPAPSLSWTPLISCLCPSLGPGAPGSRLFAQWGESAGRVCALADSSSSYQPSLPEAPGYDGPGAPEGTSVTPLPAVWSSKPGILGH